MKWLEDLLRKDIVVEIHRSNGEFFCLVTRGKDRCGTGRTGPDLRTIVEEAAADVLGERVAAPRVPAEFDLEVARGKVAAGATVGAVAREMGVTRAVLYHRLRKNVNSSDSQPHAA